MLAAAPRDLKALNLLGIALTSAGRADAGSERFRRALAIDPAFYPARKNLAINEYARGRLAEAEHEFEAVLKQAPGDEVTHVHLGEIHFARKDLARGDRALREGGRPRARRTRSWTLHYATALLGVGRRADAVASLERLPRAMRTPASRPAWPRRGGRTRGGRAVLRRPRGRLPRSARPPLFNQVLMLIEAGDHAEAIRVGRS